MKPRLRLKGRVWSCSQSFVVRGSLTVVIEIGYGYTPMAAWIDLHSRLYDLS
jgi:hypothetical protein